MYIVGILYLIKPSYLHKLLTKAKDATFELMDAVMTTRQASSLAEFSLSPMFRRQYPSTYEAIEDCRPQRNQLMQLCINWSLD